MPIYILSSNIPNKARLNLEIKIFYYSILINYLYIRNL